MNKTQAGRKAQLLKNLAKGNRNKHEAKSATDAANKLLAKYEFEPEELRSTRYVYATNVAERLHGLLKQLKKCKVWLIYTKKFDDLAAELAVIQAQLEVLIKKAEEIVLKHRKGSHYNKGQLGVMRRRYL